MYVEIIEFCVSPSFFSSYRCLNLRSCLMYVEIVDLVWTANLLMIVRPYKVELAVVHIISPISG
jgi:hypothetical protein